MDPIQGAMREAARRRAAESPFIRLRWPLMTLLGLVAAGTLLFYLIELGEHSLLDCLYQTLITITTVGYEDRLGIHESPALLAVAAGLALGGVATATWGASILTAAIVEGDLANYFKERKMEKLAEKMTGHTILCGVGETGIHILSEFVRAGSPLVVIEHHGNRVRELQEQFPAAVVIGGDATDEETLERAGIARAKTVIAALHEDRDNMFLVVTARALNPGLIIVSKCVEPQRIGRFEKAGANFVVSPHQIGGMRMASHALRPRVVGFLDVMLRAQGGSTRVDEILVAPGSALAGKTLADSGVNGAGVRIIGAQSRDGVPPEYNLADGWKIEPGAVLFFIGDKEQREKMKALAGAS